MSQKKIELNEDDFKKIILILSHSKEYLNLPPQDLFLSNLWRVTPKMVDRILKKSGYTLVDNKGRKSVKLLSEIVEVPEVTATGVETGRVDSTKPTKANKPKEKPAEDTPEPPVVNDEPEEEKVHRCRKRKR